MAHLNYILEELKNKNDTFNLVPINLCTKGTTDHQTDVFHIIKIENTRVYSISLQRLRLRSLLLHYQQGYISCKHPRTQNKAVQRSEPLVRDRIRYLRTIEAIHSATCYERHYLNCVVSSDVSFPFFLIDTDKSNNDNWVKNTSFKNKFSWIGRNHFIHVILAIFLCNLFFNKWKKKDLEMIPVGLKKIITMTEVFAAVKLLKK